MFKDPAYPAWKNAYERGILNKTQSKFWNTKPPEKLYDCIEDPDNVRNPAENPDYAGVLRRMRKANKRWICQMHDAGFMPETMMLMRVKKALYNSHANGKVQLHALNVLRTFGTGAMPLLPELEALEQKSPPSKADCYGLGVFIIRYMIRQLLEAKKGSW